MSSKMKKAIRKSVIFLMILVLLSSAVISGCSAKKPEAPAGSQQAPAQASSQKPAADQKPVEISIFTEFHTAEPPTNDNQVQKEFEKRTNTKLNIMWTSPNNYNDKQNVILASGDLPDLMKVSDLTNALMNQMASQGAFWDLGPYIKNYKNLAEYPQSTMDLVKINGKQYLLPSVRPLEGASYFAIRRDWLDKLNLKVPETMDELYVALDAFTNKDPDGNGKKDTLGWNTRNLWQAMDVFTASTGKFKLDTGKFIDVDLEQETKIGLQWMNKIYAAKLIPEDFLVLKTTQAEDMAKAGKVGLSGDTVEGIWRSTEQAIKLDPKADFEPLVSLKGSKEAYAPRAPGFGGVYMVPKKVAEDKLKKILELMDFGASEEGFDLACYGIKGVHYNLDSSGFKITTEAAMKENISQSSYGKIFERYDKYLWAIRVGMPKNVFERNKKIIDQREKVSRPDDTIGLLSKTNLEVGADYKKKIDDLKAKVIMGIEPVTAWDKYVESLKADAKYMSILKEFNDAYQAKKK